MTPQREERIEKMRLNRQHDLTVIFENIFDPHNISACLRSCDAVGISEVYILSPEVKRESKLGRKSSASAAKWITIHHFFDLRKCFDEVRKKYLKIYSTVISPASKDLFELNFAQPIAL